MEKTIFLRRKQYTQISFLDTQLISSSKYSDSSITAPKLRVPSIDLSKVKRFSPRNRQKSQSIEDLSFNFEHNDFSTPRVIRANHHIDFLPPMRASMTAKYHKPEVKIINNRVIAMNMLLDRFPNL